MGLARILIKAYYEQLHDQMAADRDRLAERIDQLLAGELDRQGLGSMDVERLDAYRQASLAFIDERIETYNPIGVQYTFDRQTNHRAADLEFELDWYNSREEFEELVAAAKSLASGASEDALPDLVVRLIGEVGAFPDRSIIRDYAKAPALQKLPDYVVACAIERLICGRDTPAG